MENPPHNQPVSPPPTSQPDFYTVRGYQLLEQHKDALTASLEDYLEMICRCIRKDGYIRSSTLAKDLNVQPSSVSKMVAKLSKLGFLDYEKYGIIRLTKRGEELGGYLLWRHDIIRRFLRLVNGGEGARQFAEAELAEHIFGKETVENLEMLVRFLEDDADAAERFGQMRRRGESL